MKTMVAFGIPPSGKKMQILRKTVMPDGDEAENVRMYTDFITEIMRAENVHVIVREVRF